MEVTYVVDPQHSMPLGFSDPEQAAIYAAKNNGEIVPAASVDPEIRAFEEERLSR